MSGRNDHIVPNRTWELHEELLKKNALSGWQRAARSRQRSARRWAKVRARDARRGGREKAVTRAPE